MTTTRMTRFAFLQLALAGLTAAQVSIVLPADPAPPTRFAAQELVRYIAALGNPAPVVKSGEGDLYLGTLPAALPAGEKRSIERALEGKDSDSFLIRSTGTKLIIFGNSARANLYGAYEYLESLGVRWYFPGPENEVVNPAPVKLDGYDRLYVPSFHKRGIVPFNTTPGLRELIDFAAKVKLNTIGIHVYPRFDPFFDAGLASAAEMIGPRGLTLDLEKHFFGDSFCPDDVRTLEKERSNLTSYLTRLPLEMAEFFLWPADHSLPRCASPRFADYTQSDLVLWFSNQMAETIRQTRPSARLAFLSYQTTEEPATRVKPGPGVFLEWAPFNQSFGYAMDDPESAVNADYRRKFEGQVRLFGARNVQVLGYWLDEWVFYRGHAGTLPYNPKAFQGDLKYYHRMGVPAITTMGPYGSRDYFLSRVSPLTFLYPRLLWDIGAEPRAVVNDFCTRYFGSTELVEVFDLLAKADAMVYVERNRTAHAERAADPQFLAAVSRALDRATQYLKSQTDAKYKARGARLVEEAASRFNTLAMPAGR